MAFETGTTGLGIDDVKVGTGEAARAGSKVTVHYTGWLWQADSAAPEGGRSGAKFDSSKDRGQPFDFALGAGQVIAGWDQGVAGMKVGGRRQLVIPPHLGYGDRGAGGGVIKPGETLVFVVDLLGVS